MENVTARQSVWSTIQMKRFLAYDTCLANWESSNMIQGEELSSTTRLCRGRGKKALNLGSFVCIPKTSHIQQETSNTWVTWISQSHLCHLMTPRLSTLPQSGHILAGCKSTNDIHPNKPTQPHQLSFPLHWKWSLQPLHGQPQSCTTWKGMLACSKSGDTGCIRDV